MLFHHLVPCISYVIQAFKTPTRTQALHMALPTVLVMIFLGVEMLMMVIVMLTKLVPYFILSVDRSYSAGDHDAT